MRDTLDVDVAVVGGGFAGLHVARLLAIKGLRVALLERHRIGWGASGRNGGFASPGFAQSSAAIAQRLGVERARELYAVSQAGMTLIQDILAELGQPELLMGRGQITCCRADQGRGFPGRVQALAATLGATFGAWDVDRVRSVLETDRYFQAIHEPDALQIHPLNFALALAADIERRGGTLFEGTAALALERRGERWNCKTAHGELAARHVVLAGNADLGPVYRRLAQASLPVATFVAVTEPLGPALHQALRWPGAVSDTRRACDYFRIVDGDRLLWGGRITTDTREPRRLREAMCRDIQAVFPQLGEVRIAHAWPGIMGYALHKMPQVGELEPGLWASAAYGGHGVAQSAAGALLVASAIADGDDRWRLFDAYPIAWAGGALGRGGTQLAYWWMQAQDRRDEARSRRRPGAHRP